MQSLAWSHKMGISTVHIIINEVVRAIWDVLSPIYLKKPTTEDWLKIASDFNRKWNFPNVIGALDGKHIKIEAPSNSGSLYFNYKKTFSIVLLATCDANYLFTMVDIGAYGSQSDGGVFKESVFGRLMESGGLNIPGDSVIPESNIRMPYVFVADEAFPLKNNIMRPYPGRFLPTRQLIFNYRLSRARMCIENTFGILVARWQFLKNPIKAKVENIDHFVKAAVVLHNYCKVNDSKLYCPNDFTDQNDEKNGKWREEASVLKSVGRLAANTSTRQNFNLRNALAEYFITNGSVPWQIKKVLFGREPQI